MLTLTFAHGEAPDRGRQVNEWLDDQGAVCARAFSEGKLSWIEWLGLGVFAFSTESRDVRVWAEPYAQHSVVASTFARTIQPLILQASGWQALHAGAAVGPAGVVAFCGRKYSGKSTLAFAMNQEGWHQFADDALVLRFTPNDAMACSLPFTPRLRPASSVHFRRVPLSSIQKPINADVPLSAVFLLQKDSFIAAPRISLIPRARAFSELLAHAHCFDEQETRHTQRLVGDYLELVAEIPIFRLEYRPDFQDLPRLTRAVVEAATSINAGTAAKCEMRPAVLAL